jgi:hypothetical protein
MRKIESNQVNPMIPLSDQDREALDEIFEKVEVEDMRQVEETVAYYSVVPLEPWEEKGWVLNSSLPTAS